MVITLPRTFRRYGQMLPIAAALWAGSLQAQARVRESVEPARQRHCEQAVRRLQGAVPDAQRRVAVEDLHACGHSGPPTLVEVWKAAAPDPQELQALVESSRQLRDRRLLPAVTAAAKDAGRPLPVRWAAVRVLTSYFDSTMIVPAGWLSHPPDESSPVLSESDATFTTPDAPFAADVPVTIGTTLADVSATATDAGFRAALAEVRQRMYHANPAATPLVGQPIALAYVCGNRFTVQNRGDITVRVTYEVDGTAEHKTFSAPAPKRGLTAGETTFTTDRRGTVRLLHRSQLLQTMPNGGARCAP